MFIHVTSKSSSHNKLFTDQTDEQYYKVANNNTSVAIKKRPSFPITYCVLSPNASSVSFGYGAVSASLSDEFLHCTATIDGSVVAQRDAMATLPLFYSVIDGSLFMSNSYSDLIHTLPRVTLSLEALRGALEKGTRSTPPHKEVSVLHAQQTLRFYNGKVSIMSGGPFLEDSRHAEPTDPKQFAYVFANYLDYFISTRLMHENVAFEVSGGLDSATLPQYAALRHQIQPLFSSLILADTAFRESQCFKIETLAQKLGASTQSYQMDHHTNYPLSRMVETGRLHMPYDEPTYPEATAALAAQLQSADISAVCTGHGGDELFGNHLTPHAFLQGMPRSTQIVKLYNNTYIERGIWPVSPFMDPAIFAWTQGLPVHMRYDRRIMRAFHKAHNFAEEIYNPDVDEDFAAFIPQCIVEGKYDVIMQKLTERSALQDLGLTDSRVILNKYYRIKNKAYTDEDDWIDDAGKLYWWMLTEITARSTPGSQWASTF